jgi:putative endonuclease
MFEKRAERALRARGLQIVEKNYRCRLGEIDLICRDGSVLIFVEVRYRSQTGFATAAASITRAKQRRLLQAAQHYLQRRGISGQVPCRIDVVAFDGRQSEAEDGIQWLKNAITL